jgi:UDP-N-acetylglucosamine 3-dehydrogenase
MPVEKLSAGVVGVGIMGQNHVRAYAEHPLVDLDAVVDVDAERAADVAAEHGATATYTDVGTAIDEARLDVVSVATPESIHLDPTRHALERDCHVLLEKPISETIDDAVAIGELVSESAASLMLGYVCRFDPRYAGLRDRIVSGEFGSILGVQAARIAPASMYETVADWTNAMYYMAVHDIDMLRWYVDAEVERVYTEASEGLNGNDTPAVMTSTLRFEDGTVGTLETNWARPESYPAALTEEIRVSGTDAYGRLVIENDDAAVATDDGYTFVDTATVHGKQAGNIAREVDHFVDSVVAGTEPIVGWEDGLRSLEVANAILDSVESAEPIRI